MSAITSDLHIEARQKNTEFLGSGSVVDSVGDVIVEGMVLRTFSLIDIRSVS